MFALPDDWVWDLWTVIDAEAAVRGDPIYHLFFLHAPRSLRDPARRHRHATIGHAVSGDLTHWTRLADALGPGAPGMFDDVATWTGSVVRDHDGTWVLTYTGLTDTSRGEVQRIGRATSRDLVTWDKDPANPLVAADPRWYATQDHGARPDEAWRDPWVFADPSGIGWHMLVTARAADLPPDDAGVIGHARSDDLRDWVVEPPLSAAGEGFAQLEVTQLVELDGRLWLVFDCLAAELAPSRRRAGTTGGIWVAEAASPLGPFDLAGATLLADDRFYVGKIVRDPAGDPVLLAFINRGDDGRFVGAITDPMPVLSTDRGLMLADPALRPREVRAPLAAVDSEATNPAS